MQYEKITDDEGIDYLRNIITSRFCNFCKFWLFPDKNFNYKDYACKGCHNLLMMAFSLDNIAILRVGHAYYRCILMGISRNEALRKLNNANNLSKRGVV